MRFQNWASHEREKIELQMTPMIDIVFQLLVFFIMTFKIVAQEGDFNVKMPRATPNAGTPDESLLPPLKLKLLADEQGNLRSDGIVLNDRTFGDFTDLHRYVRGLIGDESGPGSVQDPEIEIDCDYQLRYVHAVDAITAVSGYLDANDNVVRLVQKIKFTPPTPPEG